MKKAKKNNLDILLEYLFEQEENMVDIVPLNVNLPDTSIDQAVDRLLIQYEKDSTIREGFLREQDEDLEAELQIDEPEDSGAIEDLGMDSEEELDLSFEEPIDETEPMIGKPNLSMNSFANGVARMLINFDSIVGPKAIALNRALAYVEKNYGKAERMHLQEILEHTFGIAVPNPIQTKNTPATLDNYVVGAVGGGATE